MNGGIEIGREDKTPSAIWMTVLISVFLHATLGFAFVVFGRPYEPAPERRFAISLRQVPLMRNLPPTSGSRDAGPRKSIQKQVVQAKPERVEPEKIETPKPEPRKESSRARETKAETTSQRKPVKDTSGTKVISTKATAEKKPEVQKQETATQVRRDLETRKNVFTATSDNRQSTYHVAFEGDAGGGSPDLYRSVLVTRIGENWSPPYIRFGQVKSVTVELTIISPPVEAGTVNQMRTARITNIRVTETSGDRLFDARALEAVKRVRTWPPLPDSYRRSRLIVSCRFYLIGEE